jgi:hypothetical protein
MVRKHWYLRMMILLSLIQSRWQFERQSNPQRLAVPEWVWCGLQALALCMGCTRRRVLRNGIQSHLWQDSRGGVILQGSWLFSLFVEVNDFYDIQAINGGCCVYPSSGDADVFGVGGVLA